MKKIFYPLLLLILIGAICAYQLLFSSIFNQSDYQLEVKIRKGDTWKEVASQFKNDQHIKNFYLMELSAKLLGYDKKVKSGRYVILGDFSAFRTLRKLKSGNQDPVNFVINNITFPSQLAGRVAKKLDIDSTAFLDYIISAENASAFGFDKDNFWSMFLCNSYQLYWDVELDEFVNRMNKEFLRFWNDKRKQKAQNLGLTPEEVLVLASIVQKETNYKAEYGTVASVYLNRLRLNMPLQADPTVKFALNDMSIKRILHADLKIQSPYNTYMNTGLPPGPIGLPELNVVDAVLNAPSNKYLYFCAVFGSGKHVFSEKYSDHLVHARNYQRALNAEKILR
ncbi:MAG: endolytic transglycosylase MltG [Chitinophagales bacterium]|nr:endolytic transglycosylase MltG [Chitinophagales bacterium]